MTLRSSRLVLTYLVGACSLWMLACGSGQSTHRVFAGRTIAGPYIEPQAYAAYAEGSYLEGRGDWAGAKHAYQRALESDPDSPAIWTRLGVIACRHDLESALEQFQTDGVSNDYAPAWAERASCLRRHGNDLGALESARRAVLLDPGNAEANLLIADIYGAQSQSERASAWLFAWLLRDPSAASQWRTLLERGVSLKDRALEQLARDEVNRRNELGNLDDSFNAGPVRSPASSAPRAWPAVESALRAGDLSLARTKAGEQGVSTRTLALLAMANGQPSLGLAQAELLLAADPTDGNALIAALFASSLLGDAVKFAELLHRAQGNELPETELAQQMAELLRWYVSDAAADQWQLAYQRATGLPR